MPLFEHISQQQRELMAQGAPAATPLAFWSLFSLPFRRTSSSLGRLSFTGMDGSTMRAPMILAACAVILCAAANAVGADPATGSAFTAKDVESFVAYHNKTRAAVGVPPVEWSPEIAAYAQKWADRLASMGELEHRPVNGEWARIYGENLAINSSVVACAEAWHSELKEYPEVEPIPSDFSGFTAGH